MFPILEDERINPYIALGEECEGTGTQHPRGDTQEATPNTQEATPNAERRLALAQFGRVNWSWGHCGLTTWGDVVRWATTHQEREEKDGPGFVPGLLVLREPPEIMVPARRADCNAHRSNADVRLVYFLVLDVDDGTPLDDLRPRLAGLEWVAYTTHSHTPEKSKYRIVVLLSKPVPATAWGGFWAGAVALLTGREPVVDAQAKDPARFYYWPSCPPAGERWAEHHQGEALDPDAVPRTVAPPRERGTRNGTGPTGNDGPIAEGGRNRALYRIACSWRGRGMPVVALAAALMVVNIQRCVPPLDEAEVQQIAESAARHDPNEELRLGPIRDDKGETDDRNDEEGCGGEAGEDARAGGEGAQGEAPPLKRDEEPTDTAAGLGPHAAPWTDLGNADRFAARHAGALCHAFQFGWRAYTEGKWMPESEKAAVRRLCETIRAAHDTHAAEIPAEEWEKDKFLKFMRRSENASGLFSTLRIAATRSKLSVDAADFDQHPYLLNVANGVIDLRTGRLGPHDPALLLTQQTKLAFQPDALCPRWERFLNEVFAEDADLIAFIQRAVGYSLTGSMREETLFFFNGGGANGKGTYLETIQYILGDYAAPAPPNLIMASRQERHPVEIADLRGRRFIVVNEIKDGARLDEERVKSLVSSDPLRARLLYGNPFTFAPTHKLWIAANYRPIIKGTDAGIWRRLPLIPFTVEFKEPDKALPGEPVKDKGLKDYLREKEAAGILAWVVRGAVAWHSDGLRPPATVTEASREYREDMDWLGQFLGECCREEEGKWAAANAIYQAYQEWCKRNGELPRSHVVFGEFMGKRGLPKRRTKRGVEWGNLVVRPMSEILGDQSINF